MKKSNQLLKCPVCGGGTTDTVLAIEYQGEMYAFCCPYCRSQFVEECEAGFIQNQVDQES